MKKILMDNVEGLGQIANAGDCRLAVLGLYRIAMQHACVSLAEWLVNEGTKNSHKVLSQSDLEFSDFATAADGSFINILSELLLMAENIGWTSIGRKYWELVDTPANLLPLIGAKKTRIDTILSKFVRERNDGGEGHGLAGNYDKAADIELLRLLIDKLSPFLPRADVTTDKLYIPSAASAKPVEMGTLRLRNGRPLVYRKILKVEGGRLLVDAQVLKSPTEKEVFKYETASRLLELAGKKDAEYEICETSWCDDWSPLAYIPSRLSSKDDFTGRRAELQLLADWADNDDYRMCQVWGDGGIGKTTLVVEFLHRMLEKDLVRWKPQLITFYTAKKTRWGLGGLEHITTQELGVADAAVTIARMLSTDSLDRGWYEKDAKGTIDKLATLQGTWGVDRNSHLIILDNTETMAENEEDLQALNEQIKYLARKVGRVVITSRRRESIPAELVRAGFWSDDEGAEYLNKRGVKLGCQPIISAGDSTLRRFSRDLGNKPIVLEVFAQAATVQVGGLDSAYETVQRMQRQDLGQFLFEDAWARISPNMRYVLLLMTRISQTHDEYSMQLCCQRANVTLMAATEALEESKGIATIARFGMGLQLTFNPEFFQFCKQRLEPIGEQMVPTDEDVTTVKKRYGDFIKSSTSHIKDKHMLAYRTPYAKAAWAFFHEGNKDECIRFYDLAIKVDSENGWLYDRYAYSLFSFRSYPEALSISRKATSLIPEDPTAWFTRGLIESRSGDCPAALVSYQNAALKGQPEHLCHLQSAAAWLSNTTPDLGSARRSLERARKTVPQDKFFIKFMSEFKRVEFKLQDALDKAERPS